MNNISRISVFDYSEIEILGDLERIKIFFKNINDEKLCERLENKRKNEINKINEGLIKFMYENLERFEEDCAVDGKNLDSYANQFHKSKAKKGNNAKFELSSYAYNAKRTYKK